MNILYAINGTGNGHITKSLHLIEAIESHGHNVDILISGACKNIQINKEIKWTPKGFTFKYTKTGAIDVANTIASLDPISFIKDIKLNLSDYNKIITDFEPVAAWSAKLYGKKTIGISHQYSFSSPNIPLPNGYNRLAKFFMKNYAPVNLPIGLHFEKVDKSIFLPIIRNEIINGTRANLNHITVYLPGYSTENLVEKLSQFDREFHLFTNNHNVDNVDNIKLFNLSTEQFTKSLLECDTIITGAGFETPAEALYLGKKIICIPLKKQWEQLANAESLKKLGVRVEYDLKEIKNLSCERQNWSWQDPTDEILDLVLNQSIS